MKLLDLISDLDDAQVTGNKDVNIYGIAYDSTRVLKGYVFVCISGYRTDGHMYINDAVNNGASAVVVEKDVNAPGNITKVKVKDTRAALALMSAAFFGYPSRALKLIGVTGTNGKTTTTYLLKSIMDRAGYNAALLGTISNIIGTKEFEATRTTPESYDLQEMFYEMKRNNTDYCIMEVSSHSLELKRVEGCTFNVGVFTNLTRDHLDFHKTFENYFNAKLKLFKRSKKAVVNIDDKYGREILNRINIPVISYSKTYEADVIALNIEVTLKFTRFDLKYRDRIVPIRLSLPGEYNVYNALAAASACMFEGIPLDIIKEGLENVSGVPGRSEVIDSGRGFTIVIDYAHTPDGLKNILDTVRKYTKGRIIIVFGCGGDRDKTKRPIMGEIAGRLSDICIITSDNPRTEDPESIIEDILHGVKKNAKEYKSIVDRKEAIRQAITMAQTGDVVVIAGKGHETYQILKDKIIHFDERQIINEILNEKN